MADAVKAHQILVRGGGGHDYQMGTRCLAGVAVLRPLALQVAGGGTLHVSCGAAAGPRRGG